jgi:hypothetical protein
MQLHMLARRLLLLCQATYESSNEVRMDSLATELSQAWLADKDGVHAETLRAAAEDDAGRVTAALEALANLVTAARSIV